MLGYCIFLYDASKNFYKRKIDRLARYFRQPFFLADKGAEVLKGQMC